MTVRVQAKSTEGPLLRQEFRDAPSPHTQLPLPALTDGGLAGEIPWKMSHRPSAN